VFTSFIIKFVDSGPALSCDDIEYCTVNLEELIVPSDKLYILERLIGAIVNFPFIGVKGPFVSE
jgi:hypothetical protein